MLLSSQFDWDDDKNVLCEDGAWVHVYVCVCVSQGTEQAAAVMGNRRYLDHETLAVSSPAAVVHPAEPFSGFFFHFKMHVFAVCVCERERREERERMKYMAAAATLADDYPCVSLLMSSPALLLYEKAGN